MIWAELTRSTNFGITKLARMERQTVVSDWSSTDLASKDTVFNCRSTALRK